jgi:hypothetical protein
MKETARPRDGRAADAQRREDGEANGEAEILVWNGRVSDPSEGSDGDLVEGEALSPGQRFPAECEARHLAQRSDMRYGATLGAEQSRRIRGED